MKIKKGAKRRVVVDKNGFLLAVMVAIASLHDSKAVYLLARYLRELCCNINIILTDSDYRGEITEKIKKILETQEYPHVIILAYFQHSKRKFLDVPANRDTQKIIEIINRPYRKEHIIPSEYTLRQILEYKKKYAPPILAELKAYDEFNF